MEARKRSRTAGTGCSGASSNEWNRLPQVQIPLFSGQVRSTISFRFSSPTTIVCAAFQGRLHAFHLHTMQVRVLLRLCSALHDGCQVQYFAVLLQTGPTRTSSAQLPVLFARQDTTTTAVPAQRTQGALRHRAYPAAGRAQQLQQSTGSCTLPHTTAKGDAAGPGRHRLQ